MKGNDPFAGISFGTKSNEKQDSFEGVSFGLEQEEKSQEELSFGITIPNDTLASRNFNPGNLRFAGQRGASEGEDGFARFENATSGFDALKRQVSLDAGRGHTIDSFINKYAPPIENDTQGYIDFISKETGFDSKSKVVDVDQDKLARIMARFESGTTFEEKEIAKEAETNDPFAGVSFGGQAIKTKPVRSMFERTEEGSDTEDKDFEFVDPFIKTPLALGYGMASWPFAQAARFGAMYGQKAQQKLGFVPEMRDEDITQMGEEVANWFSTLGGKLDPESDIGKAAVGYAGKAVEPLVMAAHWINSGIDKEKYPHLSQLADTTTEGMMFGFLHKFGSGAINLGKKKLELRKEGIKNRVRKEKNLAKKSKELLKKMEESAKSGELQDIIKERQVKNQQLIDTAEGFSAIDVGKQEGVKPIERVPTKSELSKVQDQVTSAVRRPGEQLDSLLKRAAEPKLVEDVKVYYAPKVRKISQLLFDPLRNESGKITIPLTRKQLLSETTPEFRDNVRKFGKLAEQAGIPLRDFLKNNDFSNKEIRQIVKVSEAVKLDRPMASAKEMPRVGSKDFKITELEPGDTQVNVGKKANSNIKIGLKDLEKFAQIPKLKSGGLIQGLTVPETFFTKHKSLKPLLHMKRARDKALAKDTKILTDRFKDIEKTYSNKKLRKEAGALQISKGKFGEKAMDKMGVKVNPEAKYQGLNTELQPILQDGLKRMNEVREMNGRKPIKEMENFVAWFAEENFWRDVKELVGGDFNRQGPSLIHDSLETIKHRHTQSALDMGNFNHVTREGLRDGVKLELDHLVIAQRYMSELLPVIHYAELNSFIKEAMTKDLILPNGKKINFSDKYTGVNQGLAQELISWSNSLVGKSNSPLPHLVEKQLGRLRRSLTNATLVGNLRTTAIQLTALQTSFVERPGRTIQAGFDFMADLGRRKPKFDREKYNSLPEKGDGLTAMDTSFSDATSAIGGTKLQKGSVAARNTLAWGMKQLDYVAREITARAKESELKRAVKEGRLSEKEMIEQVDSTVVRTQSSGARGEVAPIQRSELGKIMTLWQTFTIGHVNWLAKEVLGIKNPELTPGKTANRVFRYVSTMAILGYVFEDLIGIQAPGPAPIQSVKRQLQGGETDPIKIALETGKELSELLPFGGSIKFGSGVYGPVFDFINKDLVGLISNTDIYNQDVLAKARKGDVKSIIKILEVTGKLRGIPGTAQVAKTARGLLRDESLMRAMIGRIYDENAKKAGKTRKRTKRKRTKRKKRTSKRRTR